MKRYFLHYDEKATVNYCFLFSLFLIAEKNQKERLNNIITYNTLQDLSNKIKMCGFDISPSSISRILNSEEYTPYFNKREQENTIKLNNNFKKGTANNSKFVVLTDREILFLLEQNNNLLNKYFLYLKYYCGFSKDKKTDSTAKQILDTIGYSSKSGKNKDNLCRYNSLLLDRGFVNIQKIRDNKGYIRNIYSMSI